MAAPSAAPPGVLVPLVPRLLGTAGAWLAVGAAAAVAGILLDGEGDGLLVALSGGLVLFVLITWLTSRGRDRRRWEGADALAAESPPVIADRRQRIAAHLRPLAGAVIVIAAVLATGSFVFGSEARALLFVGYIGIGTACILGIQASGLRSWQRAEGRVLLEDVGEARPRRLYVLSA